MKGLTKMTEVEMIKMCVVLVPIISAVITALIAGVTEWLENRNSTDLAETDEGKKLLAYMIGEEK